MSAQHFDACLPVISYLFTISSPPLASDYVKCRTLTAVILNTLIIHVTIIIIIIIIIITIVTTYEISLHRNTVWST